MLFYFHSKKLLSLVLHSSRRTTLFRLSATTYSLYSQSASVFSISKLRTLHVRIGVREPASINSGNASTLQQGRCWVGGGGLVRTLRAANGYFKRKNIFIVLNNF